MSIPVLLTVPETAKKLRCHPQTVRRMYRAGEIPVQKRGSRGRYIWESDVEEYLAARHGAEGVNGGAAQP